MTTTPNPADALRALDNLAQLVACQCHPAYTERGLHDRECKHYYADDIATLRAALAAAPQPATEDGTAECEVAWVTGSLWAHKPAPQPAPPDREALVEVIQEVRRRFLALYAIGATTGTLDDYIADALLAHGLRLPGAGETMAWALMGENKPFPIIAWPSRAMAEQSRLAGECVQRVAIRVVEGGNDAA